MFIEQKQPGLSVVKFALPDINLQPVEIEPFRLRDKNYQKGFVAVSGNVSGNLSRVETPHDYENSELSGWACSLRLAWIGMKMQGADITFNDVVNKARGLGIYRDGHALYNGKMGRIGENGITDYLKTRLFLKLGCKTSSTQIKSFGELSDFIKQGFLVMISTVAVNDDQISDSTQTLDTHDLLAFALDDKTGRVSLVNTDHRTPYARGSANGFGILTLLYSKLEKIAYDVDGPRNFAETAYRPGGFWTKFPVVAFKV
ncbi:MAG: hypothetical protein M1120_00965 [Patescibacteria group bacterium]|nr:hypothetical protein [Patescibacteria group bacterium]